MTPHPQCWGITITLHHTQLFYRGSGNLNSGPHAYHPSHLRSPHPFRPATADTAARPLHLPSCPGARQAQFITSLAFQPQHEPWGLLGDTVVPTNPSQCPSVPQFPSNKSRTLGQVASPKGPLFSAVPASKGGSFLTGPHL